MRGECYNTAKMAAGLRGLREDKPLSQRELAAQSGVSQTTIVHIERGRIRPQAATVRKLAEALGLPAEHVARAIREAYR